MKILASLLLCSFALSANAGIIYDNGPASPGDSGNETTQWVQADNFSLAAGGNITGAGAFMGTFTGDLSPWDGVLEYFIFDSNGTSPGALLTSGMGTNITTTDTGIDLGFGAGNAFLFEFDFESAFTAAAGTDYWLGLHLSADYNRDDIYWIAQGGTGGNAVQAESFGGTFDNWNAGSAERAFYLTNDATAVPEPSTLALLGLGLVGFGFARKKRTS